MSDIFGRHRGTSAVITGGSQGVGFAIAQRLVEEGCTRVVLAGRDEEKGAGAVAALRGMGCDAHFVSVNLEDVAACRNLMATAIDVLGEVNALVNAAALAARGTLLDTSLELWDSMFNTNTRAPFFLMQAFVAHRIELNAPGSIVNILSQCSHCGQSYVAAYSASKGALATLTKNIANAYRGISFAAMRSCPGGWTHLAKM